MRSSDGQAEHARLYRPDCLHVWLHHQPRRALDRLQCLQGRAFFGFYCCPVKQGSYSSFRPSFKWPALWLVSLVRRVSASTACRLATSAPTSFPSSSMKTQTRKRRCAPSCSLWTVYNHAHAQYSLQWSSLNPLHRIGKVHEVRGPCVWLASDASSYVVSVVDLLSSNTRQVLIFIILDRLRHLLRWWSPLLVNNSTHQPSHLLDFM